MSGFTRPSKRKTDIFTALRVSSLALALAILDFFSRNLKML